MLKRHHAIWAGLSLQLLSSPYVLSQASTSVKAPMLEEVIVTARKRAESIQETPVAVTAISGDDLREQGITNTKELTKSVPSLQINDSTSTQIFIRGIGQRSALARQDPSVRGSTPFLRTLQRSPIMGVRSVYAKEKDVQSRV